MAIYIETYCGCDIFQELSGVYTSPCTTYARFTIEKVRDDIKAAGYCGAPPPPPAEGKAQIVSVDLPSELAADEYIIGSFTIKNVGDASAPMRIHVTTEWDGVTYEKGYQPSLSPGSTLTGTWSVGAVKMPSQDAVITVKAQRKKDGVWITDDVKTH